MARVRAALADARNADLPEFARFFGCPAEFGRAVDQGAASDMLEFSNAAVAAPLLTADPTLLKALEPFCDVGAKARRTASNKEFDGGGGNRPVYGEEVMVWKRASKADRSGRVPPKTRLGQPARIH